MNCYFLVEGKRTEKKVYPAWLAHLVPSLRRVYDHEDLTDNGYYIISGEGYPSLIDRHFHNAIRDFYDSGRYDLFVVCLDVDEATTAERVAEVFNRASELDFPTRSLRVIAQNSCIETWFLGNRRVSSRNPQSAELGRYSRFFNIRDDDPELMGTHPGFSSRSLFHSQYFHLIAQEKRFQYTKHRPGHVLDREFLEELVQRCEGTGHLPTLNTFLELCEELRRACR